MKEGEPAVEVEPSGKKYSLFIGRWQPLHDGHVALISQVLDEGKNVCVAVRDTEVSEKNPYTKLPFF